ncbi:MAG: hypothetical protein K9I36_11120 [Bacteroidia bacterium]|nr:hypothetical protein [Bacteroidia bacterium]MCF8427274.1 hypothetical protein [Bacteroidia bacterium]
MKLKFYSLGLIALLIYACAPSRIVKPLAKGEQAVGANIGGPLISFGGLPIFIPYTSAFYAKGLNNKTTAFGSLHLTSLAFGVFQTDIGICQELYYNTKLRLGFSANPALNFAIDRWEWKAKLWPQLDFNLHKELGSNKLIYAGLCNWFELSKTRAHGEEQAKQWFASPQLGFQYSPKKWTYGIETKWVGMGVPNQPNVVDYMGPNHKGAIGVYFQFVRRF